MYYRVLDHGEVICEGTAGEISKKMFISSSSVSTSARSDRKLMWKYDVEVIGRASEVAPKVSEHEKKLQYFYERLYYPPWNVFSMEEPIDYVDELKEMGITFKWYKCHDGVGYHLERTYD